MSLAAEAGVDQPRVVLVPGDSDPPPVDRERQGADLVPGRCERLRAPPALGPRASHRQAGGEAAAVVTLARPLGLGVVEVAPQDERVALLVDGDARVAPAAGPAKRVRAPE